MKSKRNLNAGSRLGGLDPDNGRPADPVHFRDPSILDGFGSQAAMALENAQLHQRLEEDHLFLRRPVETSVRLDRILCRSAAMNRVCQSIEQVAASDLAVLILGETGTGKDLVARAIHNSSARRRRTFLSQNTAALPDSILESELFGHRRGAFSGAVEHKAGLFEAADGGTVFLDEIGEASPAMQALLLSFLDTGTFRRVGEIAERHADVRIVSATHRNLEQEVEHGHFRADLFFRLHVFPLRLPPLRERPEDIELLAEHFVAKYNDRLGRSVQVIPAATLRALARHPWPGNVRELENVVQRLLILSPGSELVGAEEVLEAGGERGGAGGGGLTYRRAAGDTLEEVERRHIQAVLDAVEGNQAEAARRLGLKRTTLRWRMQKLGLLTVRRQP